MKLFVLLAMIFAHIVDDYYLQAKGALAFLKTKKWWEENEPNPTYKYDYIVALIMHSMSWSFMILLPIAIYQAFSVTITFILFFIGNAIFHCLVDNSKANRRELNLIQDQFLHMIQIFFAYYIWIILGKF